MIFDAADVRAAPLKLFQNSLNLPEGAAAEINQANADRGFPSGVCEVKPQPFVGQMQSVGWDRDCPSLGLGFVCGAAALGVLEVRKREHGKGGHRMQIMGPKLLV